MATNRILVHMHHAAESRQFARVMQRRERIKRFLEMVDERTRDLCVFYPPTIEGLIEDGATLAWQINAEPETVSLDVFDAEATRDHIVFELKRIAAEMVYAAEALELVDVTEGGAA